MKTVVYYTSSYFLDISLETIRSMKSHVNLHVLIEITSSSKNANILNIDSLPAEKKMATPEELLNHNDYQYLKPFFEGTASVHFVLHHHSTGFSLQTLKTAAAVRRHIIRCKADAIHFEGYSLRTLPLAFLMFRIPKVTLAVHDAVLHSGEKTWKSLLPRLTFIKFPVRKSFIFYSEFSCKQFAEIYTNRKGVNIVTRMYPFTYFSSLPVLKKEEKAYFLFFGRISKYKGVDLLLDAMPQVLERNPAAQLIIAGKGADEQLLQHNSLKKFSNNIQLINRYIPNEELVQLLANAQFAVCPYTDASQSGVLMTAFAMNRPVVATNVGAFSEFIIQDANGKLIEPDIKQLAGGINEMLADNFYKQLQDNIKSLNKKENWENNIPKLLQAWTY